MLHDIRTGQEVTYKELLRKGKILVTEDIINFSKKKVGGGFPEGIAEEIAIRTELTRSTKILIIEDLYFIMTNKLLELGADPNNIYLAFGEFKQLDKLTNTICLNKTMQLDLMKKIAEHSFEEPLNIISIQEAFEMKKFDLIIANPPYGSIGANITKKIIDTLDFDQYINLLPANDYKRNSTHDLFNYQSDMFTIIDGFDAAVTTHCANIHKTKVNNLTLAEFEISQYTDAQLDMYFTLNYSRKHYAIDACNISGTFINTLTEQDIDTVLLISCRDIAHKHLPYSKNADTYRWNVLKNISLQELVEKRQESCHGQLTGRIKIGSVRFKTAAEKDNISKFLYSNLGFRFISKICTNMNLDGSTNLGKVFPKVDWTRPWTVEEILRDYNYTEEEIKEVMDDLKNYKGMTD